MMPFLQQALPLKAQKSLPPQFLHLSLPPSRLLRGRLRRRPRIRLLLLISPRTARQ